MLEEVNNIQLKAENFEVSEADLSSFVAEAQKFLNDHPIDEMNV